jgi:hypothetical protein
VGVLCQYYGKSAMRKTIVFWSTGLRQSGLYTDLRYCGQHYNELGARVPCYLNRNAIPSLEGKVTSKLPASMVLTNVDDLAIALLVTRC